MEQVDADLVFSLRRRLAVGRGRLVSSATFPTGARTDHIPARRCVRATGKSFFRCRSRRIRKILAMSKMLVYLRVCLAWFMENAYIVHNSRVL
jgi:hypothetical protein